MNIVTICFVFDQTQSLALSIQGASESTQLVNYQIREDLTMKLLLYQHSLGPSDVFNITFIY